MEARLKEILVKVLAIDPASITDETSPQTVASWDSFNGLLLVTELEKGFNVSFNIEEVIAVKNVGDIKKSLRVRGIII